MSNKLFQVNKKENIYFSISLIVSVVFYYFLCAVCTTELTYTYLRVFFFYATVIGMLLLIARVRLIGHLEGNAVEITKDQLPEVYKIIEHQSRILELSNIPTMYLLQGDGILNAFATRFSGTDYVVLYSDVLEMAFTEGIEAVEFIIAHELGHIKRNHVGFLKELLLFPSLFVPFLRSAYSRACEYTCDNVGFALSPEGSRKGLLILASGKNLYKRIDLEAYVRHANNARGFSSWLAEIYSTHPHLTKRLENVGLRSDDHAANKQGAYN
jgi:Zn-dependent protease with chaperone function